MVKDSRCERPQLTSHSRLWLEHEAQTPPARVLGLINMAA